MPPEQTSAPSPAQVTAPIANVPVVPVSAAPVAPSTPEPVKAQPQVQQNQKQPLVTEALEFLDNLAEKWLDFSGKVNHNPHIRIGQLIAPIQQLLTAQPAATVDAATVMKIAALPKEPPVIDPNYVAPVSPKILAPQAR